MKPSISGNYGLEVYDNYGLEASKEWEPYFEKGKKRLHANYRSNKNVTKM